MTCRDFIEFLMEYLAGTLTAEERALFEEHLSVCPWCVAYLKTYQETVALEKSVLVEPEAPVPAEVPEELVQAILAARRKRA